MNAQLNTTQQQYNTWLDTENKLNNSGVYEEDALLYLESIFNDIIDTIDYNIALLVGDDIATDTTIGSKAMRTVDYIATCIEQEEEFSSKGRVLEYRLYDVCRQIHGNVNVVRATLQDDVLAGTDIFIYGFRVGVSTYINKDARTVAASGIYYCEHNGLHCTCSIVAGNKYIDYPAPVLLLELSGRTDSYTLLEVLIKDHLTPMLLEFNRMCTILGLQ